MNAFQKSLQVLCRHAPPRMMKMEKRECQAMGLFAGLKAIANPWIGENIPRLGWIKLDFHAEMANEHAQVFSLVGVVSAPDFCEQLTAREDFSRVVDKEAKQIESVRR